MIAVIQRVSRASVSISGSIHSAIGAGLMILVGIEEADGQEDIDWLAAKVVNLRIFNDAEGVMNVGLKDAGGDLLVVSQFTLQASTKKGNRPSYLKAAKPDISVPIYEQFVKACSVLLEKPVLTGVFGADMQVELINDGPVTILIDTKNKT
ncbi:MAG: D-aminoacyl-tRNA deacylase [Bacteroidota bacterium]